MKNPIFIAVQLSPFLYIILVNIIIDCKAGMARNSLSLVNLNLCIYENFTLNLFESHIPSLNPKQLSNTLQNSIFYVSS